MTFDAAYLTRAAGLADMMQQYFFDWEQGGFYPYASDGEQLLTRTKEAYDGAIPFREFRGGAGAVPAGAAHRGGAVVGGGGGMSVIERWPTHRRRHVTYFLFFFF